MKTLTAVLFAGGESRRMGADKATLLFDGKPLWSRQLRTLRGFYPRKILISARAKPAWCPPDIETVLDEPPSRGPLSGLAAALNKIHTTHLLALAVDLPQITSAHIRKLWSLAQMGIGIVPQNGKKLEPLCAIYPAEAFVSANEALKGADASLHGFIRTLTAQRQIHFYAITKSQLEAYQNVNTFDQLKSRDSSMTARRLDSSRKIPTPPPPPS